MELYCFQLLGLVPCQVDRPGVAEAIATLAKLPPAEEAGVGLVTGMDTLVLGVGGEITISLVANLAMVRLLARMDPHMGCQG